MKEPLVGIPLTSVKLLLGSCAGSVVAVVPHWIDRVQLNVSPTSLLGMKTLNDRLTTFCPGASVRTPELRVKPFTPVPSVPTIWKFT